MKDITEYFRSPIKMVSPTTTSSTVDSSILPSSSKDMATTVESTMSRSATENTPQPKKITKTPTDVALIVSNMKSVISSVNHKHRKRRKHRGMSSNNGTGGRTTGTSNNSHATSNEPTEISDISNILSNSLSFGSPNCSNNCSSAEIPNSSPQNESTSKSLLLSDKNTNSQSSTEMDNIKQNSSPTEQQTITTTKKSSVTSQLQKSCPLKQKPISMVTMTSTTNTTDTNIITSSLPKHQKNRSPKKRHSKENNRHKISRKGTKKSIDLKKNETSSSSSSSQTQCTDKIESITPKKNAFDLMMNARNKVIGSNSPASVNKLSFSPPTSVDVTKIKRKLMLEDWADRKGGEKRKIQDIETSAYIEHQMNRRAKRLKRLLQNGQKLNGRKINDDDNDDDLIENDDKSDDTPFIKLNFKKKNDKSKSKKSSIKSTVTADSISDISGSHSSSSASRRSASDKYKPLEIVVTTKNSDVKISPAAGAESTKSPKSSVTKTPTKQQVTPKSHSPHGRRCDDIVAKASSNSFINKLSSPIKKRDSLLGYFNKVTKTSPSPQMSFEHNDEIDDAVDSNDNDLVDVLVIIESNPRNSPPLVTNKDEIIVTDTKTNINKRNTKGKNKTCSQTPPPSSEIDKLFSPSKVSGNRPKRQCRDKIISYRQEHQPPSPAKICAKKSLKRARRILSVSSSGGDGSPVKTNRKNVAAAKLAPIFCGKLPKPVVDLERLQARQNFLMSGIPEKMKLDIERQRQYEETFECDVQEFPLISHITQLNDSENCRWRQQQKQFPLIKYREELDDVSNKIYEKFACGRYRTEILATNTNLLIPTNHQCLVPNFSIQKKLIRHLKNKDQTKFLYFRCYKQLRKKYLQQTKMLSTDENSLKSTLSSIESDDEKIIIGNEGEEADDDDDDNDVQFISDTTNENCSKNNNNSNEIMLFTEKYQPKSSDEILVNSAPALQLKKFLSTWQESNMISSSQRRPKKGRYYNSSDDDSDDAFSSNSAGLNGEQQSLRKAMCLLGPPGCGKTMTVYALANELNFKVLEINAGCKRTGKKILQELQEATQSHHVKGGNGGGIPSTDKFFKISQTSQSDESNSFTGVSGTPSSGSISNNNNSSQKLSLILIEDADIVFDQDFGFIEAISQLITTSKRPVILALNQPNCTHLAKFLAHNTINFLPPNPEQISKWLSTLSIVEHCYVSADQCQKLYEKNGNDLKKTILELQFFVQTFGDNVTVTSTNSTDATKTKKSQMQEHKSVINMNNKKPHSHIPCPVDFNLIADNSMDLYCGTNKKDNCSLDKLANFYDNLSTTQVLQKKHASLPMIGDGLVINIGEQIIQSIIEKLIPEEYCKQNGINNNLLTTSIRKINFPKKLLAENMLSSISNPSGVESGQHSNVLARRNSIILDVEPCLRAICRSEQFRTQLDQRSSRRFYHYLRNSMTTSFSLGVFDEHCKIFQSTNSNSTTADQLLLENHENSNTDT